MKDGERGILSTATGCCFSARCVALESLWMALSDSENMRIGYNPAVAEACEILRRMDRQAKILPRIHTNKNTTSTDEDRGDPNEPGANTEAVRPVRQIAG